MSTKKKGGKGKQIVRCVDIKFEKKPKKDRKGANLILTFETASGEWEQQKVFEDVWKFVEATGKAHKKVLGKHLVNASRFKEDYLNKGKHDNAFKMIKDIINHCGRSKKILSTDSKITSFLGAKRDNLSDIKEAKEVGSGSGSGSATTSKPSTTFISDLGGGGGDSHDPKQSEQDADHEHEHEQSTQSPAANQQEEQPLVVRDDMAAKEDVNRLQQEIESLKRGHLAEISALKQENHNLKINNTTLRETNEAAQEARAELEEKVMKYEQELGRDVIGDDVADIFADEFKKVEDPAEKYYQQTKEQKKRINELEEQVRVLSHENGDLKTKLERAKYVADHLATEVTELKNPKYEQLEQDYKEVEAELDEVTAIKERMEQELKQTAKVLDSLELENAKMRPFYEEQPKLVASMEQLRSEMSAVTEKMNKLQQERDDFEDKWLEEKKRDVVPADKLKSTIKSYKEQIQNMQNERAKAEQEKAEAIQEKEKIKLEMADIKMKVGELEADNQKLEKGGGRNINLQLQLDLQNDFSLFKRDEFEYPQNISREELILWCEHFKVLIREINEELCSEINALSTRNQVLETYIEANNLPFPEDRENLNDLLSEHAERSVNDLPHPLPSMSFIDDLDALNPTKQQLKDYIDLMFNEWRRDENDANQMLLKLHQDQQLLDELNAASSETAAEQTEQEAAGTAKEEGGAADSDQVTRLKQQLESAYLKQEEKDLEHSKKMNELNESLEQLQKQLRLEQQKNKKPKDPSDVHGSLQTEDSNLSDDMSSHSERDDEEDGSGSEQLQQEQGEIQGSSNNAGGDSVENQQLVNRLHDTEQYVKDLQDEMKQLEFETNQQKQALEREYKYQIELINIDLQESRNQCDDLQRQIGSDDLNQLASEFRTELWEARNDNNQLKKKHIEEIRQLERDRDELLREINLLRIKADRMDQDTDEAVAKKQVELDKKDKELQHFIQVASNLSHIRDQMDAMQADRDELEKSYQDLKQHSEIEKNQLHQEMQQIDTERRKLMLRLQTAEQDIKSLKQASGIDSDAIITKTELVKIKEEMDDLRVKRAEAVRSKIRLLQTSSLEIERMRDEIKLMTGNRKPSKRDFVPGRYDSHRLSMRSVSSMGTTIPLDDAATHQLLLQRQQQEEQQSTSYVGSAWTYTLGMLSSIGSVFTTSNSAVPADDRMLPSAQSMEPMPMRTRYNYHNGGDYDEDEYVIRTDSRRSSISNDANPNVYGYPDNGHSRALSQRAYHQKKHSRHMSRSRMEQQQQQRQMQMQMQMQSRRQPSMAGSYAENEIHHNRGLSAAAVRAKRNKHPHPHAHPHAHHQPSLNNIHERHASKHRTISNMSAQSIHGIHHRGKQPSKQEILLESTDNENMRDAMAQIFDAFEQAEDNVTRQSQDISGIISNNLDMFSLDDMVMSDSHMHQTAAAAQSAGTSSLTHSHSQNQAAAAKARAASKSNHHKRQSSTYHSDYMRKPLSIAEEDTVNHGMNMNIDMNMHGSVDDDDDDVDVAGADIINTYSSYDSMHVDDFWNSNMNQDTEMDDVGDNADPQMYSDDDRLAMAAIDDFSGNVALQSL